jgi:hypothetical protein
MAIHYPPVFINAYLADKISTELSSRFSGPLKFFPTAPTDIETLTQSFPAAAGDVFAVFDRMFKMRRSPFPHIKCEQLLYYFYKTAGDPEALIETTQVVQDLLDNGDESAQDLNHWISNLPNGEIVGGCQTKKISGTDFLMPFFHEIKIYQLEETRDIIDFGTVRTFAGNKIIIDYEWHKS